jgi:CBS domain-containing protein
MRYPQFPEPIGVFRCVQEPVYEAQVISQVEETIRLKGKGDLRKLYHSAETWEVLPEADHGNGHQRPISGIVEPSEFELGYVGGVAPDEKPGEPEVKRPLLSHTLVGLKGEKLLTASFELSLAEAIDRLKEHNADCLAVVDQTGRVTGILTGRDVLAKVACQIEDLSEAKLRDYMTAEVAVLKIEATLAEALQLMSARKARHIPIVDDDGKPAGIVSLRSIIRYLETHFSTNGGE